MKLTPLAPLERFVPAQQPASASELPAAPAGGFGQLVDQLLGSASRADAAAGKAIEDLAAGNIDDVHGVSLAVVQADLSFRLALEIRNRLQDAYQEITRLQL